MADALAYAWETCQLLHRDIKPSNIMVDHRGRVFLMDLGLAKGLGGKGDLTLSGAILGTPHYMSPEQGEALDELGVPTDVYSLGATLYHLVTGVPPFTGDTTLRVLHKHLFEPLPPPRERNPRVGEACSRLLERMLAKKAAERHGDWRALIADIDRVLQGQTPVTRPAAAVPPVAAPQEAQKAKVLAGIRRRCGGDSKRLQAARDALAEFEAEWGDSPPGKEWLGALRAALGLHRLGDSWREDLGGGVTLVLVWCPPGQFLMGSPANELGRDGNEAQHQVTLTRGFWLGQTEVTQGLWLHVMGSNPSCFSAAGPDAPVEQVSWDECQTFIDRLNRLLPDGGFRLPTEAEWEYACRAGTTGAFARDLDAMGWYDGNAQTTTHPVGGKQANAWGLYDMHGNVAQLCADSYAELPDDPVTDPTVSVPGSPRVLRGGNWTCAARWCRSARRYPIASGQGSESLGLRLPRTAVWP